MSDTGFSCAALGPEHAGALAELFDRVGSACFCRYFHFEGDKNAWQARLAFAPAQNRAELIAHAAEPALTGVVALRPGGRVIGWMKLEAALELPKLYAQRPYRGLSIFTGDRAGVLSVGCFLVEPEERRRGVARALLRTGIELARARSARALEAFPRRAEGVRDEELFTGPLRIFEEAGFALVSEQAQYPVLRLDL